MLYLINIFYFFFFFYVQRSCFFLLFEKDNTMLPLITKNSIKKKLSKYKVPKAIRHNNLSSQVRAQTCSNFCTMYAQLSLTLALYAISGSFFFLPLNFSFFIKVMKKGESKKKQNRKRVKKRRYKREKEKTKEKKRRQQKEKTKEKKKKQSR